MHSALPFSTVPRPRTSPRVRLVLALLSAVVVGLAVFVWWRRDIPPEPSFKGHPLSWWLTSERFMIGGNGITSDDIRGLGPDAVHWLAYTAEHGRLGRRASNTWLRRHWNSFAEWIRFHAGSAPSSSELQEGSYAIILLHDLGPDAAPAIPTLVRIIEKADARDFVENPRAIEAPGILTAIDSAALPEYRRLVSTRSPEVRDVLVFFFTSRSKPEPASDTDCALTLDILMAGRQSTDEKIRHDALEGIALLCRDHGFRPAMKPAIAATIDFVSQHQSPAELNIALLLGSYGKEASAASPLLVKHLDAPDPGLVSGAAVALTMIDHADQRPIQRLRQLLSSASPSASGFAAAHELSRAAIGDKHVAALVRQLLSSPNFEMDQIVRSYLQSVELAPADTVVPP